MSIVIEGHTDNLQTTVICGGAAMMDIIFEKLEDFCRTYDWEINAIRPRDPISAVCKGAVISELCPNLLGERLLRSSYGIKLYQNGQTNMKWLESKVSTETHSCTLLTASREISSIVRDPRLSNRSLVI